MIKLGKPDKQQSRNPPLPGSDAWRLLYVVVQAREPWTTARLAEQMLMRVSSVRTYIKRLRAQGLLDPALDHGPGFGQLKASAEGVTYIRELQQGRRLLPLADLDQDETERTREFQFRTAALMVRLENARQYRRPAYQWLAQVHQRTAAGTWPSPGDWQELQRLDQKFGSDLDSGGS
tara:strand:+ start:1085 stop:1615 length:531 start_codon:yes stop_codon:yes gene_type:complete